MSKVYDSAGRQKISALWDEISQIPARVLEISVLVDPNALRYVGWNDTTNELELLTFDAADIPYDNTASGLAATEVEAALDELASGGSAAVFAGQVSSAGTTGTSNLPAGWTVTRPSLGEYTVTHSLGHGSYQDLSVVAIGSHNGTFDTGFPRLCQINPGSSNGNAFRITITTDFAGIDRINSEWFFLAQANSGA